MKLKLAALAGGLLLLAGGAAAAYFFSHRHPSHVSAVNPHRAGLEFATSPLTAMYNAPEGKTPCETAFNAYKAADDLASQDKKLRTPFKYLAPRDLFLQRCAALTPEQQLCFGPKYKSFHADECAKLLPSVEVRNQLFEPSAK